MKKLNYIIKIISIILILGIDCSNIALAQPIAACADSLAGKININKDFFQLAYETLCVESQLVPMQRGLTQKALNFYKKVAARGWENVLPDTEKQKRFTISAFPGLIQYLADTIKNKKILSLGSGRAELEKALSFSNKVVCVDAVPEMVEHARSKGLSAFLVTGSELNFESRSFDLVIFPYSISLVKDIDKMLREIVRVLKNDGKILVINPQFVARLASGGSMADKGFYRRREIKALLERNGFSVKYAPAVVALPRAYGNELLDIIYVFAQKNDQKSGLRTKVWEDFEREYFSGENIEKFI